MKILLVIAFVLLTSTGWGQVNVDSLFEVWNDESHADKARLSAIHEIAFTVYLYRQPDSAQYFAGLQYELAKRRGNSKSMANALITKGMSNLLIGRADTAIDCMTRAQAIYTEMKDTIGLASCLNNMAIIYANDGRYDQSIEMFTESMELEKERGDEVATARSLANIGTVCIRQGNYVKAIECLTESLVIQEKLGDKQSMANGLGNIGVIYKNLDELPRAIEYLNRAVAVNREIGNSLAEAMSYNNLGNIYSRMNDFEKSKDYHMKALEIQRKNGDVPNQSNSLQGLANNYQDLGDLDTALECIKEALELLEGTNNRRERANTLAIASDIYHAMGDFEQALQYGNRALAIANEIGGPTLMAGVTQAMYKNYKSTGNYKLALEMFERNVEMGDSIDSEANQKEVIRQQFKYDYDKQTLADSLAFTQQQELDDLAHKTELDKEANQRYALYGGLGFLLLLGSVAFRSYQRKKKDNLIIQQQKVMVETRNKEVTDSINYAQRIQSAILPPDGIVKLYLKNSFVFYLPKDIVAGDFYWLESVGDNILFAAADCTGHGVPGAMVSVVCHNALNNAVREFKLAEPAAILNKVNEIVTEQFATGEDEIKDGMDIALLSLNTKTHEAKYAGANNPLYHISDGELHQFKANKQPIGSFAEAKPFNSHSINLKEGDSIYLSSDGFPDQFGGPNGKKFKYKPFRELLLDNCTKPMKVQHTILEKAFEDWRGELEQVDDVCVIGVRV